MSIENSLERIAAALEAIASRPVGTPVAEAPATAAPKTRAAKAIEAAKAPVVEAPPVADAGFEEEEVAVPTRDQVRAALVECQKRVGPEKAKAALKKVTGSETLVAATASADEQNAWLSKFAAKIIAAAAAM